MNLAATRNGRPLASTTGSLVVGVALAAVGSVLGSSLLGAALVVMAWIGLLGHRAAAQSPFKDPPTPVPPSLNAIPLRQLPQEPARRIHQMADHCTVCGRPLTNSESRKARVGTQCIQTHGPRYKMIENPAWVRWSRELVSARAEQAQRQAEARVAHDRALVAHAQRLEEWESELLSEAGVQRRSHRIRVKESYGLAAWAMPIGYVLTAVVL